MKVIYNPLFLALSLSTFTSPLSAQMRDWKNSTGTKSLSAEFLSRDESSVTLRKSDGSTLKVLLDKLHADEKNFLNKNHPHAEPNEEGEVAGDAFGPLNFGDSRAEVEKKLLNSSIVKTKTDKTLFGRTGLNGIFETTHTIGGQRCFLYFDWHESGNLGEVTLRTAALAGSTYEDALRVTWNEAIDLFSLLYGKPISSSPLPEQDKLENGLMLASHLWRTSDGHSVLLGPGQELTNYNISIRFTTKRIEPITTP